MKGTFITFEGAEGSGKSTQAQLVHEYLKRRKKPVLFVYEPGAVKISEAIRRILLDTKNVRMSKECETLLYMAARAQLVKEVIAPALKKGKIVLCDRFLDSTIAYQGYGYGVFPTFIKQLGRFVTEGIQPDKTFLFDIEVKKGLSRKGQGKDRIELRSVAYHERVRRGYLKLARQEPNRIEVIKVNQSKEKIFQMVRRSIDRLLYIS